VGESGVGTILQMSIESEENHENISENSQSSSRDLNPLDRDARLQH
jgi:hypothetical protein